MIHNLPIFEHLDVQSVEQACAILAQHKEKASVIAGGTDLLVRAKYRASVPKVLINLKSIPNLNRIEEKSNGDLVIGALTKLHEIEVSPLIRAKYPILFQAASNVASRVIRNMGTLGGNLCLDARCDYYTHSHLMGFEYWPKCFKRGGEICHILKKGTHCYARYSADTAPALIALGADVTLISHRGEKSIRLENFFTGSGHPVNILGPDEIITKIQIPNLHTKWKGVYLKCSYRGTVDYPTVGIAVLADLEEDVCKGVKVIATSIASAPVRISEVEDALKGIRWNDAVIAEAEKVAAEAVNPIRHHGESPKYVKQMVGVYTKKALYQILNGSKQTLEVG